MRWMRKAGVWVLLLALWVGGCGSPEERKAYYVEKAREYLGKGNYPKARGGLKQRGEN